MASSHEQAVAARAKAVVNLKPKYPVGVVQSVGVGYDSSEWVVVFGVAPNVPEMFFPKQIDGVRTVVEFQGPAIAAAVLEGMGNTG